MKFALTILALVAAVGVAGVASANDSSPAKPAQTESQPSKAWPERIHVVRVDPGASVDVTGALDSGAPIANFDIPGNCLGELDRAAFRGKHVLYGFDLPPNTDVRITATPKDTNKPISLYAYTLPTNRFDLPERAAANAGGANCKTSVATRSNAGEAVRGEARSIRFGSMATRHNVIVGVSAPADVTASDFTVTIDARKY